MWCFCFDGRDNNHAETHTDTTDNQKELSSESINNPDGIQGEEDSKGGIQSVDQSNLTVTGENLLVDLGRVRVERALSGNLLASIEDQSQTHALAERLVLPESGVVARDGFPLVFNGLTNFQQLLLDFFLGIANSLQRFASLLDVVSSLDIPSDGQNCLRPMRITKRDLPTRASGDSRQEDKDQNRNQKLENDNQLPVPLAQVGDILGACKVDPEADE